MTIEADMRAFLAEADSATPSEAMARAAALDLLLPEACQAAVFDNLDLLRRQASLFVDTAPAGAAERFTP
ncbi:DUF4089 domain-containing protein [Caulobacter sp. B11]|uniref:DUF4089 domain-containing protein n=1 Tax=Caulobacter sp. B11 TaxID=2048899 RepID=UPI000C12D57D|nr:DUF4089 domain-containing protein [Caulobacter sp. B11]PHY13639.1 DUF4089 domain-containing protein [Caulobacter sp. B11]